MTALGNHRGISQVSARSTASWRGSRAGQWAHGAPSLSGLSRARLLTDDGLLGGATGSGQPDARRRAQQQAQHVQQVKPTRHGARRLPPPFKGTAARQPGRRRDLAAARGRRAGRRSAAGAYGKCSPGAHARRPRGGGARLPGRCRRMAPPCSTTRDPATGAPARWHLRCPRNRQGGQGVVSTSSELPFQLSIDATRSPVTQLGRPAQALEEDPWVPAGPRLVTRQQGRLARGSRRCLRTLRLR